MAFCYWKEKECSGSWWRTILRVYFCATKGRAREYSLCHWQLGPTLIPRLWLKPQVACFSVFLNSNQEWFILLHETSPLNYECGGSVYTMGSNTSFTWKHILLTPEQWEVRGTELLHSQNSMTNDSTVFWGEKLASNKLNIWKNVIF